jgi:hydroxymethylbilane synthase
VPIGGYATLNGNSLRLDGLVSEIDGSRIIRDFIEGPSEDAVEIGNRLAESVLEAGADRILEGIYGGA